MTRGVLLPLVIGVVCLVAAAAVAILGQTQAFFRAYLMSYTVWLGLGLGSMGIVFIQFLTGGAWGLATRRIFEAAATSVVPMAVLFLPLLLGLPELYAWARPSDVAADAVLEHKAIYLNVPFFVVRSLVYVVVWAFFAWQLRRRSAAQDQSTDPYANLIGLQKFSIVGSIVVGVTVSFAGIDWLMSLDADWYSTMYPPLVGMSMLLASFAFGIIVLVRLAPRTEIGAVTTPRLLNDLGSLLLAFLMLWAYMAFFQYMLIWAGNLSDEIPFYLRRIDGGWLPVAAFLAVAGFCVPFFLLLFRSLKRNPRPLAWIAGLVLVMHLVDVYWHVEPPFTPDGPVPGVMDVLTLIGLGGICWSVFVWQLGRLPVLAPNDVRTARTVEAAREAA
jgi:hypothetical protein